MRTLTVQFQAITGIFFIIFQVFLSQDFQDLLRFVCVGGVRLHKQTIFNDDK